jgi:hypothetical protein
MTQQPEALRLADAIDPLTRKFLDNLTCKVAADELRRLHAINAQLLEALEFIADRQDLMFAECSDAEEIIEVARAAIAAAKDSNAA